MSVLLQWKSGGAAGTYEVWRNTSNDSGTATMLADGITSPRYADTSAVAGSTYYYWVKTVNEVGTSGFGPSSGAILARLQPPKELVATLTQEDQITLTWEAVTGATVYEVQRSLTADFADYEIVATTGATTADDEITAALPPDADTPYYYRVIAKNGSSGTSEPSLLAIGYRNLEAPAVPSIIAASNNEEDQITVTWSAVADAQIYDVYQNTVNNSGTATLIGSTTGLFFADTGVTRGTSYYYFVKARNYTGASAFTLAAVGVSPAHASPSVVGATDDQDGFIEVTWFVGTGFITSYKIYRNTINDSGTATHIGTVSGSTLTFVDDDPALVADTPYFYWVTSMEGVTEAAFSGSDEGMMTNAIDVPATPGGVSASSDRKDRVRVQWAAASGASSYSVWRNTINDSSSATEIEDETFSTSFDDTTAVTGTPYFYWVKANNEAGASAFSFSDAGLRNSDGVYGASGSGNADAEYNFDVDVTGVINFAFDMLGIKDRMLVYDNENVLRMDTGCVDGSGNLTSISVTAGNVKVVVQFACAGGGASGWLFSIS